MGNFASHTKPTRGSVESSCSAAEWTRIKGAVKGSHQLSQLGFHESVHEIRHNGLFRVWRKSGVLFKAAAARQQSFSEATVSMLHPVNYFIAEGAKKNAKRCISRIPFSNSVRFHV